jgi:hypothetical protein
MPSSAPLINEAPLSNAAFKVPCAKQDVKPIEGKPWQLS